MHFHSAQRGHIPHRDGRNHHRFFGPEGFGHGGFGRGRFEGGPSGGRGGRGGGRRRLFTNDALKLILLKLIADSPRHGYDLIREIEGLSAEAYAPSPGVVYPTLTLLADMGLIAEQPGKGSRKLFAITEAGSAHLSTNTAAAAEALERLASLAKRAERTDGAPIRRAMHNLSMAVRARLEKEGADAQTMFDVASLIDEAATKIERL
ncbi:PadR family transcriptional regulator [Sphingobium bisphenolivorans]|uniref:PadR family transcriptional regulator n=1 Tax=Sphingobium bisphenolivorans TaxID=1335760 RepID=UPI00039F2879|nr:PadR family transcriptional regulator [Sphingobium bisphenolivorans]